MAKLSNIDIFRKIPNDLTQATRRGGLLSIFVATLIGFVLFCEVWTYIQGETKSRIVLDSNTESKLDINIDISFFELPCRYATIEVWDYLGNAKLDVSAEIRKTVISGEHGEEHKRDYEHPGHAHTEQIDKSHDAHIPEEVVELSADTYGQYLKQNEYTFVMYYVNVSFLTCPPPHPRNFKTRYLGQVLILYFCVIPFSY